jgi:hypothetical protein
LIPQKDQPYDWSKHFPALEMADSRRYHQEDKHDQQV